MWNKTYQQDSHQQGQQGERGSFGDLGKKI